jgi:hypothetical protein
MALDVFCNVEVGLVVSIRTLRNVLKTLNLNGRRWWIASDPHDAVETGSVTLGFGDQRCTDPLNTAFFRVPIIDGDSASTTERLLLLFDASAINPEEFGYSLDRRRFVRDCVADFEEFLSPVKDALLKLIQDGN